MKYGRVLTYKDIEEAKKLIGKKVICSNILSNIEKKPKEREPEILEEIINKLGSPFNSCYQFIREIIEEPQLMTNRQLAEWLARGNGECTGKDSSLALTKYNYFKSGQNDPVPYSFRIRTWDSEEWILPTVDIYERDCKGGIKEASE